MNTNTITTQRTKTRLSPSNQIVPDPLQIEENIHSTVIANAIMADIATGLCNVSGDYDSVGRSRPENEVNAGTLEFQMFNSRALLSSSLLT
jgi:hypothetical protein